MKKFLSTIICALFFVCASAAVPESSPDMLRRCDSLMRHVYSFAEYNSRIVDQYRAELYIKGRLHVAKKNFGLRYVPHMFRFEKGVSDYFMESLSDVHYTAPDVYDRKIRAFSTTFKRDRGEIADVFGFLALNVYKSTILTDKLLSPLDSLNACYYDFEPDTVTGPADCRVVRIKVTPRFSSTQLVSGYIDVSASSYRITEMLMNGSYDLVDFSIRMVMGDYGDEEFLPVRFDMNFVYRFLGNRLELCGKAYMNYSEIKLYDDLGKVRKSSNRHSHDKSHSYSLTTDTAATRGGTEYLDTHRPVALDSTEMRLYAERRMRRARPGRVKRKSKSLVLWGQMGEALARSYNVNLQNVGVVKCSPIINPMMLDYSHTRGWSYKQKFRYSRFFKGSERMLNISPRFAYNFSDKKLYTQLYSSFDYWPEKMASLRFEAGNRNKIYSSVVRDQLGRWPSKLFDSDMEDIDYFTDIYMNLMHAVEPVNGLYIKTGLAFHWRKLVNDSKIRLTEPVTNQEWAELRNIRSAYNSAAPRIRIEYTPSMYYYMNGKRKINIGSKHPTFIFDYERSIKGFLGSNGKYERMEFEVCQEIALKRIRTLSWRVGAGCFTNQESMFFVDFVNFRRHNIPEGWNDDLGGTFQELDRDVYNSSRKYARANFVYESPLLLFRSVGRHLKMIQHERLYLGVLAMPGLTPYIEAGYGFGTHVFDIGVFVGNERGRFQSVGCKFSFELFRD